MNNLRSFCRPRVTPPIRITRRATTGIWTTIMVAAMAAFLVAAQPAFAAAADDPPRADEPTPRGTAQAPPDFRFTPVGGWFAVRGGYSLTSANSDIYTFYIDNLTLEKSDFNQGLFGVDFGWVVTPRVELIFGFEYLTTTAASEDRYFVDEFGAPITQQTQFRQAPLYVKLRFNLVPRGKQIGSYSWVPAKVVPYVGAGGGFTWWELYQFGDFVDYTDLTIFYDEFISNGWAPTLGFFGGVDISLTPSVGLMAQADYAWASGTLAPAFAGFEPIDLSGLRFSFGVNFRF